MLAEVQGIKEGTLRELVQAGSIERTRVIGGIGGYAIELTYGSSARHLLSTRGELRRFTLSNAAKFLGALGIHKFEVDTTDYEEARLRKPRPDRAEALRRTRTRLTQASLI